MSCAKRSFLDTVGDSYLSDQRQKLSENGDFSRVQQSVGVDPEYRGQHTMSSTAKSEDMEVGTCASADGRLCSSSYDVGHASLVSDQIGGKNRRFVGFDSYFGSGRRDDVRSFSPRIVYTMPTYAEAIINNFNLKTTSAGSNLVFCSPDMYKGEERATLVKVNGDTVMQDIVGDTSSEFGFICNNRNTVKNSYFYYYGDDAIFRNMFLDGDSHDFNRWPTHSRFWANTLLHRGAGFTPEKFLERRAVSYKNKEMGELFKSYLVDEMKGEYSVLGDDFFIVHEYKFRDSLRRLLDCNRFELAFLFLSDVSIKGYDQKRLMLVIVSVVSCYLLNCKAGFFDILRRLLYSRRGLSPFHYSLYHELVGYKSNGCRQSDDFFRILNVPLCGHEMTSNLILTSSTPYPAAPVKVEEVD